MEKIAEIGGEGDEVGRREGALLEVADVEHRVGGPSLEEHESRQRHDRASAKSASIHHVSVAVRLAEHDGEADAQPSDEGAEDEAGEVEPAA